MQRGASVELPVRDEYRSYLDGKSAGNTGSLAERASKKQSSKPPSSAYKVRQHPSQISGISVSSKVSKKERVI